MDNSTPPRRSQNNSGVIDWGTLVLAVLTEGACHGYEIARQVERRAGDDLTLAHGTLYPVLHQLERDGYIASAWEGEPGERRRRTYQITPSGSGELQARMRRWRAVNRVLGPLAAEGDI